MLSFLGMPALKQQPMSGEENRHGGIGAELSKAQIEAVRAYYVPRA
jgi:hypothetical protein